MLIFAADENFNGNIVRGLRRRLPDLDIVRVQDTALLHARDPEVLAWAAQEKRILLTHDLSTVPAYAFQRIQAGQPMAGVFAINSLLAVGIVIEDLVLLATGSQENEWDNRVLYLPLR